MTAESDYKHLLNRNQRASGIKMWCRCLSIVHLKPLRQPLLTVTHLELDLTRKPTRLHCHFRNQCGQVLSSSVAALSTASWQIYILADVSKAADLTKMHQWSITQRALPSVINVLCVVVTCAGETSASFVCQHLCRHNLFIFSFGDESFILFVDQSSWRQIISVV